MRVLLVSTFFPPYVMGGTEQSAEQLALRLISAGHQVGLVTFSYGKGCYQSLPGLTVFCLPLPSRFQTSERFRLRAQVLPPFRAYYVSHLRSSLLAFRPDVVHAQDKLALTACGALRLACKFPLAFTVRDYGLLCTTAHCLEGGHTPNSQCGFGRQAGCALSFVRSRGKRLKGLALVRYIITDFFFRYITRAAALWASHKCDGLIFISHAIQQLYETSGTLPPGPSRQVLYNFPPTQTPLDKSTRASVRASLDVEEGPLFVYAGKASAGKGADVLLKAIPRVLEQVPTARFVLVGEVTSTVEPLLPDDARVQAIGKRPYTGTLQLLGAADAVVFPSVWPEPHGRVPLEALALGVPVIGTAWGGIPETVTDRENGLLVPPGDALALANALLAFAQDPELAAQLSQGAAKGNRTDFTETALLAGYEAFYRELASRYEPRQP